MYKLLDIVYKNKLTWPGMKGEGGHQNGIKMIAGKSERGWRGKKSIKCDKNDLMD